MGRGGGPESPVVVVSGIIGFCIRVGLTRLDLPPVPLRMCMLVLWSKLCLLRVLILVGGSIPVVLWVRVMERGQSMICRCPLK